jgi:hypothetical protein
MLIISVSISPAMQGSHWAPMLTVVALSDGRIMATVWVMYTNTFGREDRKSIIPRKQAVESLPLRIYTMALGLVPYSVCSRAGSACLTQAPGKEPYWFIPSSPWLPHTFSCAHSLSPYHYRQLGDRDCLWIHT